MPVPASLLLLVHSYRSGGEWQCAGGLRQGKDWLALQPLCEVVHATARAPAASFEME